MRKPSIVLLTAGIAILYGVIHDQITARICIEYFTVAHPALLKTQSPTILGIVWGTIATVGLGVIFGALLSTASQSPSRPPIPVSNLVRSLVQITAAMTGAALIAGIGGFELTQHSVIRLPSAFAESIPETRAAPFMAVWWAHIASYTTGLLGSALMIGTIWLRRGKPPLLTLLPRRPMECLRTAALMIFLAIVFYVRFARQVH